MRIHPKIGKKARIWKNGGGSEAEWELGEANSA